MKTFGLLNRASEGEILTGRSINQGPNEEVDAIKNFGTLTRDPYMAIQPSV
jgi:hypothetical protein